MRKEIKKAPTIRFRGFTEDWEQRKLGEITKANSFKQYIAEGTLDGTYEVIQQGDTPVVGYADGKPFEDYEDVSLFGDHTLSLYKPKSPFFVASDGIKILSPSISINGLFYYYLLMRYKPHSEGYKRHYTILKSCEALYPTECEEQKKIGEYFSNLDNLITLHQRKFDELKTAKTYFLQNMFPAKGEKVPRIRFHGFTGDWEQRKFGELAIRESETGISSQSMPGVEYADIISETGKLNKDISQKTIHKKGIKFDCTQVLYGKLRPYLHNWVNPMFKGIAVGDWWVLTPVKTDKNFLYRLIQTKQFDDVANQSVGSKMPRADWNLISDSEFAIPNQIKEQQMIGEYFSNLDNLITLHQHKLDQLKTLKKFMLQNLFI